MKKLFILLSLFTCFDAIQANAQNIINGIGKLKLDSPPSILTEIGYDLDKAIKVNSMEEYHGKVYRNYTGHSLYQLFPDEKRKYGITDASYHPSVKVFYIPKYEPVEGLVCSGLTLKFFNDSLYFIETYNPSELEDAFALKYGKPQVNLEEKDKQYTTRYGTKVTKTDQTFKMTYETGNPQTTCIATILIWYNNKGEKSTLYYLVIDTPKISEFVKDYDEKKRNEAEEKREKDKLKTLDNL
ncbi:MAG: hypothetical protein LBG80_18145 [Bacteroidales bacterium]|jgi:hypothetical protein|nr:hypothetical protein [Bacteroidales bacterium]